MTGLEASENACLIFRGADEPSQQSLVQTMSNVLEDKIIQVAFSVYLVQPYKCSQTVIDGTGCNSHQFTFLTFRKLMSTIVRCP